MTEPARRAAPLRRLRDVLADRRGVSAVEFALLLPVMVSLYLGGVGLSQAVSVDRKVTTLARTLGDLVTKADELSNAELSDFAAVSSAILAPASPAGAVMTVVAVWTDEDLVSRVEWSYRAQGAGAADAAARAPSRGAVYALPSGIGAKLSQTIVAIVDYPYTPAIGSNVVGAIAMGDTVYLRPRNGACVRKPDAGANACPGGTGLLLP